MYVKLSYSLSRTTPVFSGGPPVKIRQIADMEKGVISNMFSIEIVNHVGTHIDAPRHFSINGKKISDIDIENFFFESPLCVNVPKNESELVTPKDLELYRSEIMKADLLLIRTGFAKYRNTDKRKYCSKNPGFSAEAARYLIDTFNGLRAIGIDAISFGANEHPEEGIEAHRILLNDPNRFLFLIEDLNLEFRSDSIKRIIAMPLLVEEFDSSFCTVIGEI